MRRNERTMKEMMKSEKGRRMGYKMQKDERRNERKDETEQEDDEGDDEQGRRRVKCIQYEKDIKRKRRAQEAGNEKNKRKGGVGGRW